LNEFVILFENFLPAWQRAQNGEDDATVDAGPGEGQAHYNNGLFLRHAQLLDRQQGGGYTSELIDLILISELYHKYHDSQFTKK
jgi:hypothetical protein